MCFRTFSVDPLHQILSGNRVLFCIGNDGPYTKHTVFTSDSDMLETACPVAITQYHNYLTQPIIVSLGTTKHCKYVLAKI